MYDIYAGTQVVGRAEVIKEGLYYRFSCKCTLPDEGVYRIMVSDGNNTKDLGICVPTGEWFCLVSRVPIKYLSGDKLEFALVPKDRQELVVPVVTDEPFEDLDKLESAYLQQTDGKSKIIIDPIPSPQDSDPSQESPHIWEQP